jgi:hypothetical protein
MTETTELTIYKAGTPEAKKCMTRHCVLYGSSGQPMASVYFVFPRFLTFEHEHFIKKKVDEDDLKEMEKLVKELAPVIMSKVADKIHAVLEPWDEFLNDLDDEEICAVFNEALERDVEENPRGEFIGHPVGTSIFKALQKLDDKYGGHVCGPYYTYNDPDSYCGQHDIQFTFPSKSGDPWTPTMFDVVFLQIHPGGDARNMAEGRFYVPEGIDETTNLYDTLGANIGDLGTLVEIPVEFPLEQWLRQNDQDAWDSIYREEKPDAEGRYYKSELLDWFQDFKDGMCRIYLTPEGDNGAGVDVYRVYDAIQYKGRDLWTWVPEGEIVGEKRSQVGISATPYIPAVFEYSTGGYFKWDGPMPGTDEWEAMMTENAMHPISPRKEKDETKDAFKEE